jgi:hypothetical protein
MTLGFWVKKHTRAAFGPVVNPHLFRDAAATSIPIENPARVRIAAQVLGHGSLATTERHYNLAQGQEAAESWHEILDRLCRWENVRRALRPPFKGTATENEPVRGTGWSAAELTPRREF